MVDYRDALLCLALKSQLTILLQRVEYQQGS
jgi:hypothetical protein